MTLFDVYECAINRELLRKRILEAEELIQGSQYLVIPKDAFFAHPELEAFGFQPDDPATTYKAPPSRLLEKALADVEIEYECQTENSPNSADPMKREILDAVKRWYQYDWLAIENKLRTSIVEGISVFLSLFDDNPLVKRTFCPPKECYDPKLNADGRYGRPLPPLGELIEQGKVCAIDFPVSLNSGLARAIGCMMKLDFQRAVLNRIPKIKKDPDRYWRQVFFICDEYHEFATAGQNDPNGDEKFLALSREPRCIPIVATQSISSLHDALPGETWRTVLQAFRTEIFLTQTDVFSAKTASELCGKEDQ
ncbi:MAG: TraM recognition domain-containing protein [Terriglobia bacterium]